jgi:hypothetical protein
VVAWGGKRKKFSFKMVIPVVFHLYLYLKKKHFKSF